MADESQTDVVVVGAGLAGLTAARHLAKRGLSTVVLEARDRVGGRTLSEPTALGATLDTGGQWIGPTQDRMLGLVDEFGLGTYKQYHAGTKQLRILGTSKTYSGDLPNVPLWALLDFNGLVNKLDKLAAQVPLDAPYTAPRATEWDGMTVETWKRRFVRTRHVRAMLDIAVGAIFAADPADISFLHFLFYLRSGDGFLHLAEIQNGAQETRVHGGLQQIAQRMAAELGDGVRLNAAVTAIVQDNEGVTVVSTGGMYRASRVVVAAPPAVVSKIRFSPALPARRGQLLQRMPMGSVIKCIAVYDRPFWREAGFSGEVVTDAGPMSFTFDNTPEGSEKGALIGFISGSQARIWSERDPNERRTAVIEQFTAFFGSQAAAPIEYLDKDWSAEEWSGGCYVGFMAPGVMTSYGDLIREPVGRIHWAGTETAERWNGYMDGAVRSGERAAAEVADRMAPAGQSSSGT